MSMIGQYTKPGDEPPKAAPRVEKKEEAPPSPAKSVAEGIQEDLEQDVKQAAKGIEKVKQYDEILAENDITVEQAQIVVDDLMTKGYYQETMNVTKTITVDFRTRTHLDYMRYHTALEILNPKYQAEQDEIALRYCLAGSLARFGKVTFDYPNPQTAEEGQAREAFDKRLEWIEKQPERVVALLATKLVKFDAKIGTIMAEGVAENF